MFYFKKKIWQLNNHLHQWWKQWALVLFIFFCILFNMIFCEAFLESSLAEKWDETLQIEDRKLLNQFFHTAERHPFGFNDHSYPEKKEKPCFRMIVLGDSVIFGDGLPMEQIWSHKLEKKLKQKYPVEVLHWGKRGWSTLDQLDFLKGNFSDKKNIYDADLILISWFDNDPDMGNIYYHANQALFSNPLFRIFAWIFPNLGSLFYELNESREYHKIVSLLYSDENLLRYRKVLQKLKFFCKEKKTDLFFVILSYGDPGSKTALDKIERLFQEESLFYINLHPFIVKQVKDELVRNLYASAVNQHPGAILTTLYARYACIELVKRYGINMREKGGNEKRSALKGL